LLLFLLKSHVLVSQVEVFDKNDLEISLVRILQKLNSATFHLFTISRCYDPINLLLVSQ
jgi:hypothetical protein